MTPKRFEEVNTNVDDLELGKHYRYKDICMILKEDTTSSNGKISQFSRWAERYDLEKIPGTQYYVVNSIYDIPLEDCTPVGKKNEYMEAICQILFMLCYSNRMNYKSDKFYSFTASKNKLYVLLGLCQNAFMDKAYNRVWTEEEFKDTPKLLSKFQEDVFGKCASILRGARKSMERRNLINSKDVLEFAYESFDERGRPTGYWDWVRVGITEENQLMECKRRALSKIGVSYETEVYRAHKEEEFRGLVLKNLKELYDIEIVAYRRSVQFWANKQRVDKFIEDNYDGEKDDIMIFKEFTLNEAMDDNNDRFATWIDRRGKDNEKKIGMAEGRGRRNVEMLEGQEKDALSEMEKDGTLGVEEVHGKNNKTNWKVWDDILVEMYQDEIDTGAVAGIGAEAGKIDWKEKYSFLWKMMKEKYITLPDMKNKARARK